MSVGGTNSLRSTRCPGGDVTVTFEAKFWVGFELHGDPCIWYGEEEMGICAKLEGCTAPPQPTSDGVPAPDAAMDLADDIVDDIAERVPDVPLPNPGKTALGLVFGAGLVFVAVVGFPIEAVGAVTIAGITVIVADDEDENEEPDEDE